MANPQNPGGTQQQGKSQQQQGLSGQAQGQSGSQSSYWRQQFQNEPYYQQGRQFEDYEQAYRTGEQGRGQYGSSGQSFQDAERNLRSDYEQITQGSQNAVSWDQGASQACRAAWDRAGSQQTGDRDMQQTRGSQQPGGSGSQRTS